MLDPFKPSVAFRIETSHLFRSSKRMTGFYIKRNTGLKCLKQLFPILENCVMNKMRLSVYTNQLNPTVSQQLSKKYNQFFDHRSDINVLTLKNLYIPYHLPTY